MARVISNKPVGAWEEECPKCHYMVEFHKGDIHEGRDPDDWSQYKYVTCPKCNRSIDMLARQKESDKYSDDTY